jgi:hypothetical protein
MGLDMYAYAGQKNQHDEYWENYDHENDKSVVDKPRELAYWRKHPNLHGWMEQRYRERGGDAEMFNGVELELTWEDLDALEEDIESSNLPHTRGFFFGDPSDDYYKEQDLEFIRKARSELFCGLKVFYNSSW